MNSERELFEEWAKDQDLDITIVDFSGSIKLISSNGSQRNFCYDEFETDIAWKAWQASTQRQGYKLVPVEPTRNMEIAGMNAGAGFVSRSIYKAMIGAVDEL